MSDVTVPVPLIPAAGAQGTLLCAEEQGRNPPKPAKPLWAALPSAGELQFTVFTSLQPPRLAKVLGLNQDGSLRKHAAATMVRGTAQRCRVQDLTELKSVLEQLGPAQAVSWGLCDVEKAQVVTAEEEATTVGAISRTRAHFSFPCAPGVMMLDHDGLADGGLDVYGLRRSLIDACPALEHAPILWRLSSSAGVSGPNGSLITGYTRHRLYIPVSNASAIPSAGKKIVDCLWAAGHGWYEVGKAGQALERTLVDAAVWQPERLDFASGPVLEDGLTRQGVEAIIFGDPAALFDLSQIQVDGETASRAQANRNTARIAVRQACEQQRAAWAAEKAPLIAKARGIPEAKAFDTLVRASERNVLMGDFILIGRDGSQVAVAELLDRPDQWHGQRFADPLDPDDDRRVAVAQLLNGARPTLYTHRHGGMRFELVRQTSRVQVGRGLRIQTTDAVIQVLRARGELYDFGEGTIAYVADGRARPVSVEWLTDHLGRACDFYSIRRVKDGLGGFTDVEVREDPPEKVARTIMAKHGERGFRKLSAVITAPTLRLDGSILDRPGLDESSGLLYVSGDAAAPRIPEAPTPADALRAFGELWEPFSGFPLVDDGARGVVLQGLITACLRPALPTAPGIALDAPSAGTGKTLLARCIGILATGSEPAILPPADTDEETRKRLFSKLREGALVVLWDNVREPLGCAALDSFLTAGTFSDRILGSSETAILPNRAMFIATGNNIRLTGDTCRRILVARLDAEIERPYARDFSFDPAQRLMANRLRYVGAALTIVRAYIAAGRPKCGQGRTASFEAWDDLVRQAVCWLADLIRAAGSQDFLTIADPLLAADAAFEADPETTKHAALLEAWHASFGDKPTTVAEAIAFFGATDLHLAIDEIAGQHGRVNSRILGRWIERMQGRRIGGRWFTRERNRNGVATWSCRSEGRTEGS